MTNYQQILDYLTEFKEIIPAKMGGKIYKGIIWPSQLDKRCRELRAKGILTSFSDGKFTGFKMVQDNKNTVVGINTEPRPQNAPQAIVVPNLPLKKVNKNCKHWDKENWRCEAKKTCELCFLKDVKSA